MKYSINQNQQQIKSLKKYNINLRKQENQSEKKFKKVKL